MPKLNGLFDYFPQLDAIEPEKVFASLNWRVDHKLLTNELYNKFLYPQIVPVSADNLTFDLAIIKEALKQQPLKYYDQHFKRIYIPGIFLKLLPDIQKLTWTFIDVFATSGITKIFLRSEELGTKTLGTLIRPKIVSSNGSVYFWVHDKKYEIKIGSIMVIPINNNRVDIKFESACATLLQKNCVSAEIIGGQFGLAVDTHL